MTQKKFLQLAGIAVASVWVFCITFAIAYTIKSRPDDQVPVDNNMQITTGVVNLPSTTTAASTTNPFTAAPLSSDSPTLPTGSPQVPSASQQPTASDTTQTTTKNEEGSVPKKKNDIINAYVNGVNALKNTQNFSMSKVDTLNVNITDVQMTGGSALKNTVMEFANSIIAPPEPESYTFIGGTDAATGETPNSTIAPLNTAAQCNPDAVTKAEASPVSGGGYTVELTLVPETQTMYAPAPNLSTMVEVIDAASLLPSGATMSELNIEYAPTTVKAVFDSQGRITSIEHKLTSKGGGTGKMIINVKMSMEGNYTSSYTINYN